MSTTLTTSAPRPTFATEEPITAGELESGDFLVEIVRHRGIPWLLVERLVESVVEGPSHRGVTPGDPANLGRVRITLSDGRRPLLPVGHPVVVRRRTV